MRALAPSLVAAALAATVVAPLAAQHAASPLPIRPLAPAARTVAIYRFDAPRTLGMPGEVILADSAGTLVASFAVTGERAPRPMLVTFIGSALVLQGEAPAGLLTLELTQDADDPGVTVAGRWRLGAAHGALRSWRTVARLRR